MTLLRISRLTNSTLETYPVTNEAEADSIIHAMGSFHWYWLLS